MRVVSGLARGHKLICLDGEAIRPTSDRAKEAIFSALGHRVNGSFFLDMFSGSGAIGIEALSRGAMYVAFVEVAAAHIEVINKNLSHVAKAIPEANFKLFNKDALGSLPTLTSLGLQFDIIFLDPPYKSGLWKSSLEGIYDMGLLKDDGIIVLELGSDEDEPELANFKVIKKKVYGSCAVYYMETYK